MYITTEPMVKKMNMSDMTKALLVYIKKFKLYADIKYETTAKGFLKGVVELQENDQLDIDEFAARLEFYDGGDDGDGSTVKLIDGTGCTINKFFPTDGRDMLQKLKLLIPPKPVTNNTDKELRKILDFLNMVIDKYN
jgi:hypothetical protein